MTASARRRWRLRSLLQRITRRLSARDPLAQSLRPAPRGPTDAGILFEPLEPRLLLSADFGDAPAPYPTTLAQNGAQHTVGTLKLGDGVDMESDGAPSVNADGDDTNGADDEDGVSFGAITVGALDATVTVNVQGAIGKLDAWIDFDGDGSWAGAAEHIFTSVDLALGNNDLTFDVPSWATAGTTYARFRLSTAGGLAPTGAAADGEVEDYAVTITNPTPASGVFASHLVSSTEGSIRKVITADVDGDGDMDLLSASYDLDEIAWFENDGAENFSKHVIDNAVDGAYSVVAVDFDGDGDIDVVSAAYAGNTIAWHENDGSQNFTTHVIDNAVPGAADVSIADMDGDGDLDVVFAARLIDLIAWYANNGDGTFFYHPVITSQPNGVISLATADLTGDGRIDILAGSSFSDDVILFVSGGPLANPTYTSITVGSMADDVRSIFVSDIDSDGDLDVVSTSVFDDRIAWYENDGVAVTPGFTTHTITDSAAAPWQAFAADIDGDGDVDLLAASAVGDTIAWYENDGNQQFTQHVLTTSADGAFSVFAADIDGDGDLDAVAASEADGTIAWFENLGFDYGDAPLPYPTTLAEDGPRHGPAGMILGTARDTEDDGVHSASADADDLDTADDEDGVTFGTIMVGALDATVAVTVTGVINTPTGLGRLDAWIDFNGDGSFDGPGEQIFDSLFLFASAQPYQLTYDVPSWAKAGTTYARFRVSTDGDLGPSGPAYDGEVEDYAVTIVSPSEATGAFGEQNIVTTDAHGTFGAFAADVDGDGDMDLLSASYGDNKIAWYENDGSQNFAPHTITAAASGAFAVSAADVDGDGDMDVLAAVYLDDTVAWYENDGSENFTPHTITTAANGANSVFSADLDGDGDLDVLGTSTVDDTVRWYENDGAENFTPHTISDTADGAYSVFAADIDGDGDLDVVSASIFDDTVAWYENNGAENFTEHVITTSADGAVGVFVADVDGDGDLDVLSASQGDNTIAWYENDGSENFTPHPISTSATGARAVFAADMDGDGDVDVLGSALSIDTVLWLENDGSEIFTPHTITTSADGVWGVLAADVDGDGDLDVISASYFDEKLAWYENLGYDFGDAPSPYPSSLADNGPRHGITGPTLGATRDEEPDVVIFTDNAYTDDSTGIADEDGVTFGVNQVGQLDATVIVNVQGGPAKLDAWIDFNGDGSWGGPGEQIFDSVDVVVGDNLLTFDVPSWAKAGETYARFRLSTAGDLGITGVADDGEVEDHRVVFSRPTGTFGNFSDRNIISDSAFGADSVFAADVDGDGDMDVLSASRNDDTIAWYENDGTANFTPHTITASADAAVSVFAADVDGDGDIDVLSASVYDDKIAWYENDGSENFTPHTITTTADGAFSVFAADVDGDGDMDVLSASGNDDTVAWYENDGAENFTPHTVTNTADGAFSVFAADVDGDGDLDVLSASFNDDKIAWYENDGSQNFTGHTITAGADGAWSVFAADVDGDGDMDVLSASYYDDKIAWYENDGSQVFTAHTIDAAADGVYSVFAADVNGDSRVDVLSASRNDTTIAWYENDGSQNFTKHAISTTADGYSVIAADVDGDGDLDVLIASKSDRTIAWYENQFDDYGDAPDNYGTLRESNGARHVRTGMTLGSKFDLDVDGQPSANADGDDLNGLDDDDGVTLGTIRVGALDATVTVNVQGQAGKLDAWIDFNGDGSFGGPGEQIFDTVDVALGDNVLTYDVPSWAIAGVTYARFRLSPTGNLAPTGNATGGEVEDYAVTIENAAATPGVFGGQNVIGTSTDHPFSVFAADIDGDGDMDMLSASQFDNKIAWYENDGSQNFTAHIVSTGALSAFSVIAADVDGDGDVDVLSASYNDSKIAWYENDGAQNFTEHTVGFATGAADVFAADVDGDGDLDVLSAAIGGNRIAWYENDGAQSFTAHTITTAANGAISVFAADMDSDGDMDVLSASEFDDKIAWYENDGTQSFTEHAITTTA
ncbi:MAG: LEPR-XLL domain-containing protein, partial [Phycisphaera sp.]|nr:LEPR-XLL domain-containing protein [Phycisphaera sp.]